MTYKDLDFSLQGIYEDLDEESKRYPLEFDERGTLRFKKNLAVAYAMDALCQNGLQRDGLSLNSMSIAAQRKHWPTEDVRMFYRMSGYSLCGFMDIFGDKGETL